MWSTVVNNTATINQVEEWNVVNRSKNIKPKSPPKVRIRGTKMAAEEQSNGVKAIPIRKPVLSAFVGRLHCETTEEILTEYLMQQGMLGVVCRRLKPKEGQKFNTAAFYVSCCAESSDLFYSEASWLDGAELRDWIYKH